METKQRTRAWFGTKNEREKMRFLGLLKKALPRRYLYRLPSSPDRRGGLEGERAGSKMGSFQSRGCKTADPDRIGRLERRFAYMITKMERRDHMGKEGMVI